MALLHSDAGYLSLNLSCPNAKGGKDFFATPGSIAGLLERLEPMGIACPVCPKIAPGAGRRATRPPSTSASSPSASPSRSFAAFASIFRKANRTPSCSPRRGKASRTYKSWADEDLRRLILNGIVWTAKLEVPAEGVKSALPDLATFQPASVEPAAPAPRTKGEPKKEK